MIYQPALIHAAREKAIPNMSASPELHATPPAASRHIALWERLVQRFGAGDPWQAGLFLIGWLLLVLGGIGAIIANALLHAPEPLFTVVLPLLTAVESTAWIFMCLAGLRWISHFQPWWTRPFPALAYVSGSLFMLSVLIGLPHRSPWQQLVYATSDVFLRIAAVSAALALVVWLIANWKREV
jgi:hypothetical protein